MKTLILKVSLWMLAIGAASIPAWADAGQGRQAGFELTLSAFSYIPVGSNTVTFTWTSSFEANVQDIELQGGADSLHFATIDVQGAFDHKQGHTYYSREVNISQFKYYRLRILNEDGSSEYSKVLDVTSSALTQNNVSLFPNPIQGMAFNLKVATPEKIEVNVFSKEGILLYSTNLQGNFQYRISLPSRASGIMNLVVQVTQNQHVQTFNVLNR